MRGGRLGAGVLFNPSVPDVLTHRPEAIDYVSIVPDILQIDQGRGRARSPVLGPERFVAIEQLVDVVDEVATQWPIVAHGVGLSIGSPGRVDAAYLARMRWWVERYRLVWFSEHLSFFRVPRNSTAAHEAGLAAPLPLDRDVLRSVARKAAAVQAALGVPFLLENGVTYVRPVDYELEEPAFLGDLARLGGCGLLLDLHNVYVNAWNLGFDAARFVDEMDVSRVVEVHVAGGDLLHGMYTDAHSGAVPEAVWALLDRLLARAPSVRAVTFEFHESCLPKLGLGGVTEQLMRAREALGRSDVAVRVSA
jgi:hypothetical protein